jgi:hypothetical protein
MGVNLNEIKLLCENAFVPAMNSALWEVFRAADAAVTQLAMEATLNADQNRYFEAVQGLRIEAPELISKFSQRLLAPLSKTESSLPDVDAEHVNGLRKLLSINLELWSADTALAAATLDLRARLQALDAKLENPLAPEHVVNSFIACLSEAKVDINTKMLMLRMFEAQVYTKLERYVRMVNDVLIAKGVLARLDTQPSEIAASINALVEEALGQEVPSVTEDVSSIEGALADLQANDVENIDKVLSAEYVSSYKDALHVRDLIKELETQKLLARNISPKIQLLLDRVDLVGKLFEYVLSDNNLPLEAKVLLRHLQLPYARIALVDVGLLQNNKHPAKALLNEIMTVCESWQPQSGQLADDVFFKKLTATIQSFLEIERVEKINYQEHLFEYLAYSEGQRQKNTEATQRLLDSQLGAEVADTVREAVTKILEKKVGDVKIPSSVQRIFDEGWNNVLYMTALQSGLAAPEWQQAVKVVDDLIASVKPAETFASRSAFILQLPDLLKALRKGLQSIDLSTALINQLLSDLETEHKNIVKEIKGDFSDLEKIEQYRPVVDLGDDTLELIVEDKPKSSMRSFAAFTPDQIKALASEAVELVKSNAKDIFSKKTQDIMSKMSPGILLLWNKEVGSVRCRVAAHIKHTKKFIITDRSGVKLAEISEFDLAQKIDCGEIETIVSEQLFDRALESVIGDIRDRR